MKWRHSFECACAMIPSCSVRGDASPREGWMSSDEDQVTRRLRQPVAAWAAFTVSDVGLPDADSLEPGAMDEWSVKDILAHVTTWEEEALTHLPHILAGGRPPRYVTYGGLDAFNAQKAEQK